jgi:hypothetical protein
MRKTFIATLLFGLLLPFGALAQKSPSDSTPAAGTHPAAKPKAPKSPKPKREKPPKPAKVKPPKAATKSAATGRSAARPAARSTSPKKEFMVESGYPKGRPGYVVVYIVPLECGGPDIPSNMQWLTVDEAKIKRRTERECRRE